MDAGVWNLLRGRLPSYTRKARHLQLLGRYANPKKLANLTRVEIARMRGDIVLKGFPYIYTIDTGNVCNLRCPLCPTGFQGLGRNQSLMSLDTFLAVVEKIEPYAIEVILHNWGEPFLNPDIIPMLRHAKARNLGTAISSNMNLVHRGRAFLEEVVDSGLEHLTVSLDGTTQEVYETYRRGGVLSDALDNLAYLLEYRRASGSRTPRVEWQFLVMKHNQHQMDDARKLAKEMGTDRIRFTGAGLPFESLRDVEWARQWLSDIPEYRGYAPEKILDKGHLYDERCYYLYRSMTINPRGEVSPCCVLYNSDYDFGNLVDSPLESVWNNAHYRSSRAWFSGRAHSEILETACGKCPLYKPGVVHGRVRVEPSL